MTKQLKSKVGGTQGKILDILSSNIEAPLSYRDIASNLGLSSTNTIAYHIKKLEQKGHLKRDPHDDRHFVISRPQSGVTVLNLYGLARCGKSNSPFIDQPIDRIPISNKLIDFPAEKAFLVRAKGDSMEPRIQDCDLLLAKRQRVAENGDVVVCINDETVLIKKIIRQNKATLLTSYNPLFGPVIASEDFQVLGVIRSVVMSNLR